MSYNFSLPGRCFLIGILGFSFFACTQAEDSIRNWGRTSRLTKDRKLERLELKKWERDLNLSRARAQELNKNMQAMVRESNLQGRLAWKIARAYCITAHYEAGTEQYKKSIGVSPEREGSLNPFEKSLPYIKEALLKKKMEPQLLFDAGLCFANASRAMGWESERFKTAVLFFERLQILKPTDLRAKYQLALLFGKSPVQEQRNTSRAVMLLKDIVKLDERDLAARFALGHILVETGELSEARQVYEALKIQVEEMHKKGIIPGSLNKNRQFIRATENIEKLDYCIQGSKQCEILIKNQ